MQQYNIRYSRNKNIVVALIVPPLVVMACVLGLAFSIDNIPEWSFYAGFVSAITLAIIVAVVLVKKLSPVGTVTLTVDGFSVNFPKETIFTPRPFEIKTRDIINFYTDENNGNYYMAFSTATTPAKFNLSAEGKKAQEVSSFNELISAMTHLIDENNEKPAPGAAPIAHITMYERPWAKLLVVAVLAIFLVVTISKFLHPTSGGPSWLRIIGLIAIGTPFIYKVYYHNYSKKNARGK